MSDIPNRAELEKKYARLIAKLLAAYGGRLLEKLGDPPSLDNLPADFWDEEAKELIRGLSPFGRRVFLEAAERLMIESPIGVDWALVNTQAVEWAQGYIFDLVKGLNNTTRQSVQASISDFFQLGQTREELEDRLAGVFGPVRAEMIAVTEVTRAAVEGERAIARELAINGIVMTEIWNTNNDELVCELCSPLNQKPKGDGWTEADGPPRHVRCRCWTNHELPKAEVEPENQVIEPEGMKPIPIHDVNDEVFELYGYRKASQEELQQFLSDINGLDPYIKQLWNGESPLILAINPEFHKFYGTHQGHWIVLGSDALGGTGGIAQHEFIHHIINQSDILGELNRYNPIQLFTHAQQNPDWLNKLNEDITCMLSSYNKDPVLWAKEISGEGEGIDYNTALEKIKATEEFINYILNR